MEEIRLNKYLSEMGVCSRREADRLIGAGKVLVDGEKASAGMKVTASQLVICDGKPVGGQTAQEGSGRKKRTDRGSDPEKSAAIRPKPVLLAVNKPRGVVCTTSGKDRATNIVELVHYPERVYPAGRLDKDSEGLIFMTNQGDLVNQIMRGGSSHEKEYVVVVHKPLTAEFIREMEAGVWLGELNVKTKPCRAWITGKREFHIVLTQGLNRQIRRMCGALGYQVQSLTRIRIMNVRLGRLKSGTFRRVTDEEYKELLSMLEKAKKAENAEEPEEAEEAKEVEEVEEPEEPEEAEDRRAPRSQKEGGS